MQQYNLSLPPAQPHSHGGNHPPDVRSRLPDAESQSQSLSHSHSHPVPLKMAAALQNLLRRHGLLHQKRPPENFLDWD